VQLRENAPSSERILPPQPPSGPRGEHPNPGHRTYPEARQVQASNHAPTRRAHHGFAVTALFFPRTRDGRIIFACVIVSLVLPITEPAAFAFLVLPGVIIWAAIKRRRRLIRLTGQAVVWAIVASVSALFIALVTFLLALLASNGAARLSNPITEANSFLSRLIGILMGATIWLLMGVPHQAYKIRLDKEGHGSAQSLLVSLLAATACVLTGIYIGLLHYTLLREIPVAQLAVGIIFTVVLLAPYYRSLARACWRRGVPGFLMINEDEERPWRNTANELLAARRDFDQTQATRVNEGREQSQPYSAPQRRVSTTRWIIIYLVVAIIAFAALTGVITALTSGGSAKYSARIVNYAATNSTDLAVMVEVTNTGSKAGTPTCTINALGPSYSGIGSRTLQGPVAPGTTTTFVANVAIANHGAPDVTQVMVIC